MSLIRTTVWIALAAMAGAEVSGHAARQRGSVRLSEDSLREAALQAPMPSYPADALRAKLSGTAVASIVTDAGGRVSRVDMLESPDPSIADAVRLAVSKWTFKPVTVLGSAETRPMEGKLVFFFRIAAGKGSVVNPDDMPQNREVAARRKAAQAERAARRVARGNAPPPAPPRVVEGGGHGEEFEEVGEPKLREMAAAGSLTFLDIRERDLFRAGHRAGAINILVDELESRARVELPLDRTVVVDCAYGNTRWCHVAGLRLRELGFTRVVIFIP